MVVGNKEVFGDFLGIVFQLSHDQLNCTDRSETGSVRKIFSHMALTDSVGDAKASSRIVRGESKMGLVQVDCVGPKSTIEGTPSELDRCIPPESFPITQMHVESSCTSCHRFVFPQRLTTLDSLNSDAIEFAKLASADAPKILI